MSDRDVIFWSCEDGCESLRHTDPDEAVQDYLEGINPEYTPRALTLYGYARMPVSLDAEDVLGRVLEMLDDEYGGPDGDSTGPTPTMSGAAQRFVDVVRGEYKPWGCEIIEEREIIVAEWAKANGYAVDDEAANG